MTAQDLYRRKPLARIVVIVVSAGVLLALVIFVFITASSQGDEGFFDDRAWSMTHVILQPPRSAWAGTLSPDGKLFVATDVDRSNKIIETSSGNTIATWTGIQSEPVQAIFSRDGSRIVTAGTDPSLVVWDVATKKAIARTEAKAVKVVDVEWSFSGEFLVTFGGDEAAQVWDAETLRLHGTLKAAMPFVQEVRFSPRADLVAMIAHSPGFQSTLEFRDVSSIERTKLITLPTRPMNMAFSHDGELLATGFAASPDENIIVWDCKTYAPSVRIRQPFHIVHVRFLGAGKRLLLVKDRFSARIWDLESTRLRAKRDRRTWALDMAKYSLDGRLALTVDHDEEGEPTAIRIWKKQ